MWTAAMHVFGALVVTVLFGIITAAIGSWEDGRIRRRRAQDASIALGVPVDAIENDASVLPRLLQYASQRSSDELLRNRVSDLCGLIRVAWGWLGWIVEVGVLVGVSWNMHTGGAENAVLMWLMPIAAVFFWLASIVFSLLCLLLTGRYPGEAKAARKAISASIEQGTGIHLMHGHG